MNEAEFRADVCQSQSIERIKVNEHTQLFKQHLKATQYVYERHQMVSGQTYSRCIKF